jgi:hypothetical protein
MGFIDRARLKQMAKPEHGRYLMQIMTEENPWPQP